MLSDLGKKIFLDRYALKDINRVTLQPNDTVLVITDPKTSQREIATLKTIKGNRVSVVINNTQEEMTLDISMIDKPLETEPEQLWKRVSDAIATMESDYDKWANRFYNLLKDWKFIPGGRILAGAGTGTELSFYNCYVLKSPDDSRHGILKTLGEMTEIMSRGGGVGINISTLRPKQAYVKKVNGRSSGSVSWGSLYSYVTGLVEQGGCFAPNVWIDTDKGLIQARDLYNLMMEGEEFQALTHVGYKRIVDKFDNGIKPVYRVTTETGRSVDVTIDHKMAYYDENGKIDTKPLKDFIHGDSIITLKHSNPTTLQPDRIVSITLLGEVNTYDFEVEDVHLLIANNVYCHNSRRGALILILEDWHPDLLNFIHSKRTAGQITNANISVGISDKFMQAIENDDDWTLRFPDTTFPNYDQLWDGDLKKWEESGFPVKVYQTLKARDIWNQLVESAWASAEPGLWFIDRANHYSNGYYFSKLIAVNPCGEINLGQYGVCNLGAINLSKFWNPTDNDINWNELESTIHGAVRFLDDVVDATPYFMEENKLVQLNERRLGLNTMGLADLMIQAGIRYGSDASLEFIDRLYEFIRNHAYRASINLAIEKGSFPKFEADKIKDSNFIKTLPLELQDSIYKNGLRNVALLTGAPTGSTGTLVSTSTGIEPYFSFEFYRKGRMGTHKELVTIAHEWKKSHPNEELPDYFVTAMDLSPDDHVRVQARIQKYICQSLSKTANLPNTYTIEDTDRLYKLMYELGCKGGTVYRDGSRDEQVLNLKKEEPVKAEFKAEKRPDILPGKTLSVKTSVGTVYVTINEIQPNQPFEVFVSVGKGGSDLEADSEGYGRLCSLILRSTSDKKAALNEIINQLEGIGGANPYGMGKKRILSLPDAVAHCLKKYTGTLEDSTVVDTPRKSSGSGLDLCPSCHNMTLLREDGCKKCLNCEYSAC